MAKLKSHWHHTYRIDYLDPDDGEWKTIEETFYDYLALTAYEQACDMAYSLADKGPYQVKRIE